MANTIKVIRGYKGVIMELLAIIIKPLTWLFRKMLFRFVTIDVKKDIVHSLSPKSVWSLVVRNAILFTDWKNCSLRLVSIKHTYDPKCQRKVNSIQKIDGRDSFDLPYGASISLPIAIQRLNTSVLLPCKVKNRIEFLTEYKLKWMAEGEQKYMDIVEADRVEMTYELQISDPAVCKRFVVIAFIMEDNLSVLVK